MKPLSFGTTSLSTLESLVLECALENARSSALAAGTSCSSSSNDPPENSVDFNKLEMNPRAYEGLIALPGSNCCADCGSDDTEWGSVTFGILICTHCSGIHRALGTHISRVRSVKMDNWTDEQMKRMRMGGNNQCNAFLMENRDSSCITLQEKYTSEAAAKYKQLLDDRAEGRQVAAELIESKASLFVPTFRKKEENEGENMSYQESLLDFFALFAGSPPASRDSAASSSQAPTITYMGRSFLASSPPKAPTTPSTMTTSSARPNALRKDLRTFSDPNLCSLNPQDPHIARYFYREHDVLEITSDETEFARLQEAIRENNAITNTIIQQRMFAFVINRKNRLRREAGEQKQLQVLTKAA